MAVEGERGRVEGVLGGPVVEEKEDQAEAERGERGRGNEWLGVGEGERNGTNPGDNVEGFFS